MKKALLILVLTILFWKTNAQNDPIAIETQNTALILKVAKNGLLYQSYLGTKLDASAYNALSKETERTFVINDGNPLLNLRHEAYPTYGTNNLFESAIRMTHNDGNPALELIYVNHQTKKLDSNTTETSIKMKDPVYPVEVALHYKAFYNENVIEQWTEIVHREKKPVTLYNYASSMLHFDAHKYWLTQFHGDWAKEVRMQESELARKRSGPELDLSVSKGFGDDFWLFSRNIDLSVFLGSAVVSLLLLAIGWRFGILNDESPDWTWISAVLLIDIAHVWSTSFRVYFDTAEFKRRFWLYILVPIFGYAVGVAFYSEGELTFWRALAIIPSEKSNASTASPIWARNSVFFPVPQPISTMDGNRCPLRRRRVTSASRSRVRLTFES